MSLPNPCHSTADKSQGWLSSSHGLGASSPTTPTSRASFIVLPRRDARPIFLNAAIPSHNFPQLGTALLCFLGDGGEEWLPEYCSLLGVGSAFLLSRPQGQLSLVMSRREAGPVLRSPQTSTSLQVAAQTRDIQLAFGDNRLLLLQGHGPRHSPCCRQRPLM